MTGAPPDTGDARTGAVPPGARRESVVGDWAEGRRYPGLDILAESRLTIATTTTPDLDGEDLPALTA